MDAKKIRFAIIGTGSMAVRMMSTFHRAGVPVVSVFSQDADRSQRFAKAFGIESAAINLELFLQKGAFDAVYVANSNADHAKTVLTALQANKAVLCEKPLARSVEEAERIADAARQTGMLCMEALWIPFLPAYRRFLELAKTKACGDPNHLFADFGYPVSEKELPRLLSPAAGGVLLDRAIYLVALAIDLFGTVRKVTALLDGAAPGMDRNASLQLSHLNGGQSQLSASFTSLMSNTATLACSRGFVRLEEPLVGAEVVSTQRIKVTQDLPPEPFNSSGARKGLIRSLRKYALLRRLKQVIPSASHDYVSYGSDQYLPQLLHFLGLLSTGANESDVIPMELSLSTQRVIELARSAERC